MAAIASVRRSPAFPLLETEGLREHLGGLLQRVGLVFTSNMHQSSEYLTRAMIYPLTPGKYRNLDIRACETLRRLSTFILHGFFAPIILATYIFGGLLKMAGEKLSSSPYYLIKGKTQAWNPNHFRVMTFNTCSYWGGLPDHGGGLNTAATREKGLLEIIKRQNPTVLALQEESFGPGVSLAEKLKDQYAFIYTNIGAAHYHTTVNTTGPELFFASKVPVVGKPSFFPYKLHSDKIGYFCVETEVAWFLTAHFPDGQKNIGHRKTLLDQVHQKMEELERTTGKKAVFMGDLNVHRTGQKNDEYDCSGIRDNFYDPALTKYPVFNENTATCTNTFLDFRREEGDSDYEIDDYILCSRSLPKEYDMDIRLGLESYVPHKPERSISDHRYYVCDFSRRH